MVLGTISESQLDLLIDDTMDGSITVEETSMLITLLVFHRSYLDRKIAVLLHYENSYDHNFFDKVIEGYKIQLKHYIKENDAIRWLVKK